MYKRPAIFQTSSIKLPRNKWAICKSIGILITPLVLFFIPIEWLQGRYSVCLFKNIFGTECYGCGMTRAVVSAVQLDFWEAYRYNKLIVIVFPLLIYIWTKTLIEVLRKIKIPHSQIVARDSL